MLRNGCRRWREIIAASKLAILAGFISLAGLSPSLVQARGPETSSQIENIALIQLPPQARDMMTLIYRGGPFRYDKDGAVFGNRERILPAKNRGYYREYTVRTPSERTRGARRIICGGVKPAAPEACYYTDDHYASFRRIVN
ncbi:MAG: ribonuclease [Pseudomonadota bacterium]